MRIEELGDENPEKCGGDGIVGTSGEMVKAKAKRILVGAGGRVLFYPTLFYNVVRNKMQAEFRWWDEIDQFILLGAVPFPNDVPRLRHLGVRGVITLNEPFETLVQSSLYKEHGIDHLVIPTRDYLFAPSLVDISRAVDFIHRNASQGRTTYVHCKAGRGRSTTIVLCYLVEYKNMTPSAALEYVRSRRPRVLLHLSQWKAVEEYSKRKLEFPAIRSPKPTYFLTGDEVVITATDLEGYNNDSAKEQKITKPNMTQEKYVIVNHVPSSPLGGDEVLVTEADLEGYDSFIHASGDVINSDGNARNVLGMRRLCCLFISLKVSSTTQSDDSSRHEIQVY